MTKRPLGSVVLSSPSSFRKLKRKISPSLSVGPELRYRTSASNDRYLFLRTVAEFQQWRSDRMGPVTGDTLGLQGASMNFGALW